MSRTSLGAGLACLLVCASLSAHGFEADSTVGDDAPEAGDTALDGDAVSPGDEPTAAPIVEPAVGDEARSGRLDGPSEQTALEATPASQLPPSRRQASRFGVMIGAGVGFGIPADNVVVYGDLASVQSGVAFAPPHLQLQARVLLVDRLHLVPVLRTQFTFLDSSVDVRPMGSLRLRYDVARSERLTGYLQAGGGYGYAVHLVPLDDIYVAPDGRRLLVEDRDRALAGRGHVGLGAGLDVGLSDRLGLVVDTWVMALFPEAALAIDLTLGLAVDF